jgi:hypothetical protein
MFVEFHCHSFVTHTEATIFIIFTCYKHSNIFHLILFIFQVCPDVFNTTHTVICVVLNTFASENTFV